MREETMKTNERLNNNKSNQIQLTRSKITHYLSFIIVLVTIVLSINSVYLHFAWNKYANIHESELLKQMIITDIIIVLIISVVFIALMYIQILQSRLKNLYKKFAIDEALYKSIFEQAPIGISVIKDMSLATATKAEFMSSNPMYEKILGRKKDELYNMSWVKITHFEDLQKDLEQFEKLKKGEISSYAMEKRFIRPDGSTVWTNMKISSLLGLNDESSVHICLLEDITELKNAEIALKEKERRESVIMNHLPGLAYRCSYDSNWTMQYVSDGCYNLTGYKPERLINNKDLSFNDLIVPEYRDLLRDEWELILKNRLPFKYEYEIMTSSGERRWVLERGQGIYTPNGEVEALEGIILDISELKEIENNLRYINEHDGWTGLYNRDYLEVLLEKDAKERHFENRALISINLSTVQLLTANYGFHYTQNIIKKAAEKLSEYCTEKRLLFQTYENRFVFYLKDYKDINEVICFSEEIGNMLESLLVDERIGGGIGIIEINQNKDTNIDLLLKRLLIASEKSISFFDKDFRACFYDEELEYMVNREGEIRHILSRVAADDSNDELNLEYQPIYDLKLNRISGFEALARLKTEKLGIVSPTEFIPIAEKTKLIIPIGEKILINSFRFLNKLKEYGYDTIHVSINVSAVQLMRPDFTENFLKIAAEMNVNKENIGIEMTETVFASDYEYINNIIASLKGEGIQVAIDDFGTGYSSLAREKQLGVDCLKIDKFFIDRLLLDNPNKSITGDIISMAHKLDHYVVAEGVEHKDQLKYLKENDCDKIQGYLVSKPLDEEKAIELLIKEMNKSGCH